MNRTVNVSDILFKDKVFPREVLDPIRDSIKEQGLHHPLLVQEGANEILGGKYKLFAGLKRLKCLIEIGEYSAPVKIFPKELTDDQLFEISLHENLRRYNIPWYEQVTEELRLHELRVKQKGAHVTGRPRLSSKDRGWSQADTARELGIAVGVFSEDLMLARAINLTPSLAKVKDKTTAIKLARQQAKREISEVESLAPSEFEMNQVFLGDSLDILAQLPASTFDACITDPPWTEYKDDKLTFDASTLGVFEQVYRLLRPDSFLLAVVSTTDFFMYQRELPKFGYQVQSYPCIWVKPGTITHGRRGWEFARDFEPILIAVKGSPVLASTTESSSVFTEPSMHHTRMIHPHEKPVSLMTRLIKACTFEGAKILDPFAGSGVTLEAARQCGRQFIGVERNQTFYENIKKRLEKKDA